MASRIRVLDLRNHDDLLVGIEVVSYRKLLFSLTTCFVSAVPLYVTRGSCLILLDAIDGSLTRMKETRKDKGVG